MADTHGQARTRKKKKKRKIEGFPAYFMMLWRQSQQHTVSICLVLVWWNLCQRVLFLQDPSFTVMALWPAGSPVVLSGFGHVSMSSAAQPVTRPCKNMGPGTLKSVYAIRTSNWRASTKSEAWAQGQWRSLLNQNSSIQIWGVIFWSAALVCVFGWWELMGQGETLLLNQTVLSGSFSQKKIAYQTYKKDSKQVFKPHRFGVPPFQETPIWWFPLWLQVGL